jgi:hypothetical protein
MELELMKSKSSEDSARAQVESLTNIKESLKNKLREYKSRLETLMVRHEQQSQVCSIFVVNQIITA